jgi:hypothetical protein
MNNQRKHVPLSLQTSPSIHHNHNLALILILTPTLSKLQLHLDHPPAQAALYRNTPPHTSYIPALILILHAFQNLMTIPISPMTKHHFT